jgi:glycosyltransferase involved in cell wall biosynthesis
MGRWTESALKVDAPRDWGRGLFEGAFGASRPVGPTGGELPPVPDADAPPPRVALFTETFDEVNGVATTYRRLLDYSERTGRSVHIYCNAEKDSTEERGNCRIYRFAPWLPVRYYENLSWSLIPNPLIAQVFYENQYDLIHVAAPGSLGQFGMWLNAIGLQNTWQKPFAPQPVIGVYHTRLPEYATQMIPILGWEVISQIPWQLVKAFYDKCNLVLATTPKMAATLKADGLVPPVKVLARGIDAEQYNPAHRTRPRTPDGPPVALYVGRLSVEKNLAFLANAATRLRAEGLDFRLVIVGDGPYRAELEAQLPWAEFKGYLKGTELSRAFADGDFFVFPSLTDTLGNVVLEAMASGLPVLVADTQGPGELVHEGVDGFVAPGEEEFAERFRLLVGDATCRAEMGRAARANAVTLDWSRILEDLWTIYGETARSQAAR